MSRCKLCNIEITDPTLDKIYYDEDYPSIDIGPYCEPCMGKIRICSGCHRPKVVDVEIRYFSKGNFYCTDCAQNIEACDVCGDECTVFRTVDGIRHCEVCFKDNFFECGCCNSTKAKSTEISDRITQLTYAGVFKKYNRICKECFDREHTRFKKYPISSCKACNNPFTNPDGFDYCPTCDARIKPCVLCGKRHHRSKRYYVDSTIPKDSGSSGEATICGFCINSRTSKCNVCRKHSLKKKTIRGRFSSAAACSDCAGLESQLGECKICLRFKKLKDNGACHECNSAYGEGNKCTKCGVTRDYIGNCRVCGGVHIYNYSTKPPLHFHYTKADIKSPYTLFMGVENEISFSSSSSQMTALKHLYKNYGADILIAKSDSSIHDYGFEVVTQPITLDMYHHMDLSGMFFSKQQKSSSCGMHVHVGREHFKGDVHIFKICQFIHNNEKFIDKVAGRCYNGYSDKFDRKPSAVVKRAKQGNAGRGRRVNLTNSHTIEFRMFAGCTREFEFRYRIEFIHALMVWSKDAPVSMDSVDSFKQYVENNSKMYPNLFKFLQAE